jgi:tetratricopeptide (TPR) repeat protein
LLLDHTPQRLAAARVSVEKAQQIEPELLETQIALGWLYYYGLEKYDSAQAAFMKVLKLESDNSEANSGLARVKRRFGLLDEAVKDLKKAIRFDPRQSIYYREIAITLNWNHRKAEALQYWNKAIDLAPDNRFAHAGKAYTTLDVTGSPRQAREVLCEALETLPRWAALTFAEAEFYFMERMNDSALALLTNPDEVRFDYTLVDGPDSSSYYLLKGEIYLVIDESELAKLYFDSARVYLETIPSDGTYHYASAQGELALAYARLGYTEKAVSAAMTGIRLMEHDKMAVSTALYSLALVHIIIGQPEKAIDELETLLSSPSWLSSNWLKLNPLFDPLRDHPRFQALIEKYEKEHGI